MTLSSLIFGLWIVAMVRIIAVGLVALLIKPGGREPKRDPSVWKDSDGQMVRAYPLKMQKKGGLVGALVGRLAR